MADILPILADLGDQQEYQPVNIEFTAELDPITDKLVSLEIIKHRENEGITIVGSGFSGEYRNSFQLDEGAIKIRMRSDGSLVGFNSWDGLPPPTEADIIQWKAPSVLTTTYSYTLKLVYEYTAPIPTPPPTRIPPPIEPVIKEVVKEYTQIVFGDYDIWSKKLRKYVSESVRFQHNKKAA